MDDEPIPDYESYQFTIREKHEDLLERKLISINLKDGQIAVDLGGGYGRLTDLLLRHFKFVILIDYSERNLERAVKNLDSDRILFVLADIRDPPLMEGSVDFIMSIRVMHHYPGLNFLSFIVSKLRNQGSFLFNVNNLSSPIFALHMMKSLIMNGKVGLNFFKPGPQGISDTSSKRDVYFLNYKNLLYYIPKTCRVEKVIGTGLFHNSMIESISDYINIEKLTTFELHLSKVIKNARLYPDVFMLLTNEVERGGKAVTNPLEIIMCSVCGNKLRDEGKIIVCDSCGKKYEFKGKMLDMRNISGDFGSKNHG
ncbi:MAG: methyltransferase domain-containing protein [Thermoplasmata archaeon]